MLFRIHRLPWFRDEYPFKLRSDGAHLLLAALGKAAQTPTRVE
jgi:hypothetical protein